MNLFKGLEKFGLKTEGTENLFEEEKRTNASTSPGNNFWSAFNTTSRFGAFTSDFKTE